MQRRRVVVTGLGIFVSNGRNVAEFRDNLFNGVSGIKEITQFDTSEYRTSRAGAISEFDAAEHGVEGLDRASQLALVATREAVKDSGICFERENRYRTSVCVGTSLGGMLGHMNRLRRDFEDPPAVPNAGSPADVMEVPPCQIANLLCSEFDIRGGNATVVTACAAGSNSITLAVDLVRQGRSDVVVSCASDPLSELSFSGFNVLMALSRTVSRPFDRNRDGLAIGEGAATLILEEYEHARQRGAPIYGEILGYGLSNDAYHPTQPDPDAGGARRAMLRALRDADVEPEAIDYINAHGTSTQYNDLMELKAIASVYGAHADHVPISSIKAMVGHTLGAAGTIEAVATLLAVRDNFLPPTINFQNPIDSYAYDFVPVGRPANVRKASSHSFGFGGAAACVIFGAAE
jgi:3-oxoacyl-[acyl-carrier-protein] synthase II